MVMRLTPRSQARLLCDEIVPSGEQYLIVRADVYGEPGRARVSETVGVVCPDQGACINRAVERAYFGVEVNQPSRNEWQSALRKVVVSTLGGHGRANV